MRVWAELCVLRCRTYVAWNIRTRVWVRLCVRGDPHARAWTPGLIPVLQISNSSFNNFSSFSPSSSINFRQSSLTLILSKGTTHLSFVIYITCSSFHLLSAWLLPASQKKNVLLASNIEACQIFQQHLGLRAPNICLGSPSYSNKEAEEQISVIIQKPSQEGTRARARQRPGESLTTFQSRSIRLEYRKY